jgi:hypothetical protein
MINAMQFTTTNLRALPDEIIPEGISLIAVLGFFASKCLSRYRLNAIAALRAKTMHSTTRTNFTNRNFHQVKFVTSHPHPIDLLRFHCPLSKFAVVKARKKPIIANGIAKMV